MTTTQKLILAQRDLIAFYGKCISNNAMFLAVHHAGASEEDIKEGERLRKIVAKLEVLIIKEENQ